MDREDAGLPDNLVVVVLFLFFFVFFTKYALFTCHLQGNTVLTMPKINLKIKFLSAHLFKKILMKRVRFCRANRMHYCYILNLWIQD